MSLDKGIEHGKEHRKPYYCSGKHDRTCRPNGSCSYCRCNRTHTNRSREGCARQESLDWYTENALENESMVLDQQQ